jgi:hypothetical protein
MRVHPITLSQRSRTTTETKEVFDWTLQTRDFLRRLHGVLSKTIEAWHSFNSTGGSIDYFLATDTATISPYARRALKAIRETFADLQKALREISSLRETCSDYLHVVSASIFVISVQVFPRGNVLY